MRGDLHLETYLVINPSPLTYCCPACGWSKNRQPPASATASPVLKQGFSMTDRSRLSNTDWCRIQSLPSAVKGIRLTTTLGFEAALWMLLSGGQ